MTFMLNVVPLSSSAFAGLGRNELAYVKPIVVNNGPTYAIHAADGTQLAVVQDRLVADAMIRRNDLEPTGLH